MRGHRLLRKRGNLGLIASIQSELTEKSINMDTKELAPSIFGPAIKNAELVVRQYLLLRLGGVGLATALLYALAHPAAKVAYPIPHQWRMILEKHGFQLSHWRCELLWRLYSFTLWGHGIVQIWRTVYSAVSQSPDRSLARERYVYFVGLSRGNLPQREGGISSHDIVSWYLQWRGRDRQISSIRHSVGANDTIKLGEVTVVPQSAPLPSLSGMHSVLRFLLWGAAAASTSLANLVRGHCWNALLLNQAVQRVQAALLPADLLATEYFFHNSQWMYRPLWTYELDSKGSTASLYFYSTNCERFKDARGYPSPHYGYAAMNWPRYLVWDGYQADFVRRVTGGASEVVEVGPIWFTSSTQELDGVRERSVALFDVTPFRHSKFCEFGMDNLFYTSEVANAFVRDVVELSRQVGADVLWKRKRNVARSAHPKYRSFIDLLNYGNDIRLVAPEISAIRVIQASQAVISMPFTSTALIARSLGVPSVYYDPSGIVQRDDRAAHGIEILIGRHELDQWLKEIFFLQVRRAH